MSKFNNEEDIKLKVVVPYLKDLGFSVEEIEFEYKFEFKLGRSTFKVDNEKQPKALGFTDILIKSGEINLFILEIKSDKVLIVQNDIEQAISYARLVTPIAPFAIITNGKETKVYDTIKKEELSGKIESPYFTKKDGIKLSTEEDLNQRYLAIQNFIGYSKDNLIFFSKTQIDQRISNLRSNAQDFDTQKKYIPELYLSNKELGASFKKFIESDKQLFAITGESGVGKTNAMCFLTESILEEHITFFFNGTMLNKPILSSLNSDCDWFFSQKLTDIEIIKKLVLFTSNKRKLIIFVDAIDEVTISNFHLELNELSKNINQYSNIKLCLSCKSNEWSKFLDFKGIPSSILDILYKETESKEEKLRANKIDHSFRLKRFSNNEVIEIDEKYRRHFNYQGKLSPNLIHELKLGFTFRIFAEIYENKQIPSNLNDLELLSEYYKKVLEKLDYEIANSTLIKIAEEILKANISNEVKNSSTYTISETELRKKLILSLNEKIYPKLFSHDILTRASTSEDSLIGFYYGRLRNFIIATKVLKLQIQTDEEFQNTIKRLIVSSIGQEILLWYYTSSICKHKVIFKEFNRSNALIFLNTYEQIIETYFYNVKDRFDPYTKENIGLTYNTDIEEGSYSYSFFPIEADLQNKLIETTTPVEFDYTRKAVLRSDRDGFFIGNPENKAIDLIFNQLKEIAKNRELYESKNVSILKEKILAVIHEYPKDFNLDVNPKGIFITNFENSYPINLDKILDKINYAYAFAYYKQKSQLEFVKKNIGKFPSNNAIESLARTNAENAIKNKVQIPVSGIFENVTLYILKSAIISLQEFESNISEHYLPEPDINHDDIIGNIKKYGGIEHFIKDKIIGQFSEKRLIEYVEAFFILFLKEYKIFIEQNFSGLEHKFQLYSRLPVNIYCNIYTKSASDSRSHSGIIYGFQQTSKTPFVRVNLNPVDKSFNSITSECFEKTSTESLWRSLRSYEHNSLNKIHDLCPLRNFLYERVEAELKELSVNSF